MRNNSVNSCKGNEGNHVYMLSIKISLTQFSVYSDIVYVSEFLYMAIEAMSKNLTSS